MGLSTTRSQTLQIGSKAVGIGQGALHSTKRDLEDANRRDGRSNY